MIQTLFLVTLFLNSHSPGVVVVQIEAISRRKVFVCVQSPGLWLDHLLQLQISQQIPPVQVQNSCKQSSTDSPSPSIL